METLRIVIAGLGTVGGGVINILKKNKINFESKLKKKNRYSGSCISKKKKFEDKTFLSGCHKTFGF